MADPRAEWFVYEGEGGGPSMPVVRSFKVIKGEGIRVTPKDETENKPATTEPPAVPWVFYERAVNDLKEAHRDHVASLERQIDRLSGERWSAGAAIHALVHPGPAGGHRIIDGHRIVLAIEVANLSPFTWEATDIKIPSVGWAEKDRRAGIQWDERIQASLADRIVPIARDFADPIKVTIRISAEASRQFGGSQDLYMEPAGILLVVRRGGSAETETIPVRLAAGPIFLNSK